MNLFVLNSTIFDRDVATIFLANFKTMENLIETLMDFFEMECTESELPILLKPNKHCSSTIFVCNGEKLTKNINP